MRKIVCAGLLACGILWGFSGASAEEADERIPGGVYMRLSTEFYRALEEEGASGSRIYTNDPSLRYLRQISVSSRFMVETNLQIIRQQERILELLKALPENRRQ